MESIISDSKCRKRRTIRLGNSRKIHRLDSYDYYVIGYFYYRITIIIVFDYTDIQKNTLQGEKNRIIKVVEGLPKLLRVFREGLA